MKAFQKINEWIVKIYGTVSLIFVAFMTIIIAIQVFYRYVLNIGLVWTDESARFLCIWACMLGSAILIFEDEHIKITLFEDTFPAFRRPFHLVQRILILIYAGFMVYLAFDCLGLPAAASTSPAMKAPMMLVYIVYPFFSIAALIHALWHLLTWIKPEYEQKPHDAMGEEGAL